MNRPEEKPRENHRKRDVGEALYDRINIAAKDHFLGKGSSHAGHYGHQPEDQRVPTFPQEFDGLLLPVALHKTTDPLVVARPIQKNHEGPHH